MKIKSILLLLLVFATISLYSQPSGLAFEKYDVRPGRIVMSKHYNDSSLWGYLNGGADIYLEYGFIQLTHQEIIFQGMLFKMDIFEMSDSAAAYGIYSVSSSACKERNQLYNYDCFNPKQIQLPAGRYYINLTNIRGDSTSEIAGKNLVKKFLMKHPFPAYEPPSLFKSTLLENYLDDIKVINGPLGLQNGFANWTGHFEGIEHFFLTLLSATDDSGEFTLAKITFENADDLKKFIKIAGVNTKVNNYYLKHQEADKTQAFILLDDYNCLYLEAFKKHKLFADLLTAFDKVGNSADQK